MQTQFAGGVSPWAGLRVSHTGKTAKDKPLAARQKPAAADDAPHQKPRKQRPDNTFPRGEKVGTSRLKAEEVLQILEMVAQGDRIREQLSEYSHKAIAAKFGVRKSTIYAICYGIAWSSVTGITNGGKQ